MNNCVNEGLRRLLFRVDEELSKMELQMQKDWEEELQKQKERDKKMNVTTMLFSVFVVTFIFLGVSKYWLWFLNLSGKPIRHVVLA